MRRFGRFFARATAFAAALAAGCNAQPQTHPVRGTVTYKGKPVFDGLAERAGAVVFHPLDDKQPMAKGEIAADGSFTLTTFKDGDGAPAGKYKVAVHAYIPSEGLEGMPGYRPPKPLLPGKYMILDQTPVRAEVAPGENVIPLKLDP